MQHIWLYPLLGFRKRNKQHRRIICHVMEVIMGCSLLRMQLLCIKSFDVVKQIHKSAIKNAFDVGSKLAWMAE